MVHSPLSKTLRCRVSWWITCIFTNNLLWNLRDTQSLHKSTEQSMKSQSYIKPPLWSKAHFPHLSQKFVSAIIKKRQGWMFFQWFVLEMFWKKHTAKLTQMFSGNLNLLWYNSFNYVCLQLHMLEVWCKSLSNKRVSESAKKRSLINQLYYICFSF